MPLNLPRSAPEAQGVNPAAVTRFIDAIEAAKLELHSFMMLRHGAVVAEGWWAPYGPAKPHMLFSLSKSFTSTAVGFAVAEGLLSVEDPVLKFFADEAPAKTGRNWDKMKVRHLLSMSTGHDKDTTGFMVGRRDGDWVKGFLLQPVKHKPGTHFLYNTGATYMLSVIVQKLTGQRVLDYLTPRLFEPLGIEGAKWEQCPKGYDTGGFGLSVKTEDIARFGQFLLQRGQWQGRQLLPASWVDEATGKQVENGNADGTSDWGMGYGYQFWRCVPDCYRGDGAFGQYCIVVPRLDLVFAITSGVGDMQVVLNHIWNILLPGVAEAQPDDLPARRTMEQRLAGLKYGAPALQARSPLETALEGRVYRLERNKQRLTKLAIAFRQDECDLSMWWGRRKVTLRCGRGHWVEQSHPALLQPSVTPLDNTTTAASFTWEGDGTLAVTIRDVHAPFTMFLRLAFSGEEVEVKTSLNVSFGPTELPAVKGKME